MTRIAIHKCGEPAPVVRNATPEEEAKIEAQRAIDTARAAPKSELELLKERVAALESNTR